MLIKHLHKILFHINDPFLYKSFFIRYCLFYDSFVTEESALCTYNLELFNKGMMKLYIYLYFTYNIRKIANY